MLDCRKQVNPTGVASLAENPSKLQNPKTDKGDNVGELSDHDITKLLNAWRSGNEEAEAQLIDLVYPVLKAIAHRGLESRDRKEAAWQTTDLANEAYLRLVGNQHPDTWESRTQFFGFIARLVRQVLLDTLRGRKTQKRGRGLPDVIYDANLIFHNRRTISFTELDQALTDLEKIDPRKARIIELRFFAGLDINQTAEVLKVSPITVKRDWRMARAWLLHYLTRP